jgi:hypothetical protein
MKSWRRSAGDVQAMLEFGDLLLQVVLHAQIAHENAILTWPIFYKDPPQDRPATSMSLATWS